MKLYEAEFFATIINFFLTIIIRIMLAIICLVLSFHYFLGNYWFYPILLVMTLWLLFVSFTDLRNWERHIGTRIAGWLEKWFDVDD